MRVVSSRSERLVALESVRGLAALYVFLDHIAHQILDEAHPWMTRAFVLGQAAVMAFFVLWGFVVYDSRFSRDRSPGFRDYFVRRLGLAEQQLQPAITQLLSEPADRGR